MYLCIDIERKHETSTMIEKEGEDRELNEGGWSDRESYTVPFTRTMHLLAMHYIV